MNDLPKMVHCSTKKGFTNDNAVLEEAQASIRAARYADDLDKTERYLLIRDALTRLKIIM